MINKIAVLTSGGDAPGMNAAIRAVVRSGLSSGLEVFGVYDGYKGLYDNKVKKLDRYSVSDVINRGGTFLGSSRFLEFKESEVRKNCADILRKQGIGALVVIGGDGSYIGAKLLSEECNLPCIGIPGTIDNDVKGTDYTIGYHTALETAVEAIDKLRDTSVSHNRIFIVEIMGRHCSDLTISAGIAGGCEFIIANKETFDRELLIEQIKKGIANGKSHNIIAIAENICDVDQLAKEIESKINHETRASILGHIQRGGVPCAFDRILASRMGVYAVDLLLQGKSGVCVGVENNELVHYNITDLIQKSSKEFKADWLEMSKRLY